MQRFRIQVFRITAAAMSTVAAVALTAPRIRS